jgi:LmbE family N-acetylglucosaminyl deacetylase
MRFEGFEVARAMVVYAHPDDAEFGSSGTVAKWVREGVEVVYVLVTNGASGSSDPSMTRQKLAEIRRREQLEAAEVLGVKEVVFLGFEDGYVEPSLDLRKAIAREIRRWRPDVLFTADPTRRIWRNEYVNHPDHIAVGECVLRSINPDASSGLMFPELRDEEGLEPHLPQALLLIHFEEATTVVDITETMDLKLKALACHRSQVANGWEGIEEFVRERNREIGKGAGCEYGEGYRVIRTSEED